MQAQIIRILMMCTTIAFFAAPSLAKPSLKGAKAAPAAVAKSGPQIDINTASAAELAQLKGIGKKRAAQIVKDREENGPFSSPQDLTRIKGIGPKTVSKNLGMITVSAPASKSPVAPAKKASLKAKKPLPKVKAKRPRRIPTR